MNGENSASALNELIPLSYFKDMRDSSPVSLNKEKTTWNVFKYEDVKMIFTRHDLFSSQGVESVNDPIESSILRQDPPKHRRLRMLVSQAFTPRIIQGLTAKIEAIAEALCDQMETNAKVDGLPDYASPLPIIVIAEMLGIPPEDRERFKAWSDALVGNDSDGYYQCQQEMSVYFSEIADRRRLEPQDDLISNLVRANEEGAQLSDVEVIGFCILLLVAGNETTTNLISSAMLLFDDHPDAKTQLKADNTLIPQALEEVLRYCSPVQTMIRTVTQTTVLRGQTLTPGQIVNIWIGSANHDEAIFEHPEIFDIHRNPNPHLAFGHGIHFCLGAQLARLESKIAMQTLLRRFPEFRLDHSQPLERIDSWIMFGVKQLPIILRR
ncbi:putative cytochrome P450 YjiB [Paenibacillus marchantiophytorum]|uniref:Cytochrome P450 YjiB n=1 Tax=Paenibacillus marchantiophytorum TaxID=1619310 RepID=A0ABQ2BU67_9BACL|nr:cytochrome P450 [Paenibacillus marchantiophytorum]GGI45797.1 putative cytochrome P450 YjiB [Paenibacillus marchantiophytorum]